MNNFKIFWKELLINPKSFFKYQFSTGENSNYTIALIVFGLGYGINKLDTQLMKFDLKGKLDDIDFLNNWIPFWAASLIGGMIGGYIFYLIGGWFYNVRIKWSRGEGNIEKARKLFLFSSFYPYLVIILITIYETFRNDIPYDPTTAFELFDAITVVLLLCIHFYSIYISYCGVTMTTKRS